METAREGHRSEASLDRVVAPALVMASALSTQLGSAFAVKLFALAPPTTAAFLRNAVGAAVLLGLAARRRRSASGAAVAGRLDWRLIVALGVVLGTMNATFYEAIARLPLGDAVSIEFIGPIQRAGKTSWNHFRAPDGTVFEILSRADEDRRATHRPRAAGNRD